MNIDVLMDNVYQNHFFKMMYMLLIVLMVRMKFNHILTNEPDVFKRYHHLNVKM